MTDTATPRPDGQSANGSRVWDLPTRLFHWAFAALIVFAYVSAEEDSALRQWHMAAGYVVAVLLVFRLVWGLAGGEYARFAGFVRLRALGAHVGEMLRGHVAPHLGHNPLGGIAVLLMLLVAAATVATGALLEGEGPHELLGTAMIVLAAIHVAGVVLVSILSRENLARAMVTGRKQGARHPAGRDARRAPAWAAVVALLAMAGATWAIVAYDPLAFTPRAAEHHEGGGETEAEHEFED